MRRTASIAVLLAMAAALFVVIPQGQAATTASFTDPVNDVLDQDVYSNSRNNYAKERPANVIGALDLVGASMSADNNKVTFTSTFNGTWPEPGSSGTACTGPGTPSGCNPDIPVGLAGAGGRWLFAMEQVTANKSPLNSMTARQLTNLNCTDQKAPVDTGLGVSITPNYKKADCTYGTQGPFHHQDGFFYALDYNWSVVNTKVQYRWSAVIWSRAGINGFATGATGAGLSDEVNHNQDICFFSNPALGASATATQTIIDQRTNCKKAKGAEDAPYGPVVVNGLNWSYSCSAALVNGKCPLGKGVETKNGTWVDKKNVTVVTPYRFRNDFSDDFDSTTDEEFGFQWVSQGDNIEFMTAFSSGVIDVRVPPNPVRHGQTLWDFSDGLPEPAKSALQGALTTAQISRESQLFTSLTVSGTIDWAPGNPFAGVAPYCSGATCTGTPDFTGASEGGWDYACIGINACSPNWGGNILAARPAAGPQRIINPLGAPSCRYPISIFVNQGLGVSATTRLVDDPMNGVTYEIDVLGNPIPLTIDPVPPTAADPDGGDLNRTVGPFAGGDAPCEHIFNGDAAAWLDSNGDGNFFLTAGTGNTVPTVPKTPPPSF